jgi:hypothetical protein
MKAGAVVVVVVRLTAVVVGAGESDPDENHAITRTKRATTPRIGNRR